VRRCVSMYEAIKLPICLAPNLVQQVVTEIAIVAAAL
jgi:hypothetical protein